MVTLDGLVKQNGSLQLTSSLNTASSHNGVSIGKYFQEIGLSAWANYDSTPFISWDYKYSNNDGFSKYSIPGQYYLGNVTTHQRAICGLSCRIDSSSLTPQQRNTLLGRGTFLPLELPSRAASRTRL